MRRPSGILAAGALALAGLAGCSSLPSSGPTVRDIVHDEGGPAPAYRIVSLTPANLAEAQPATSASASLAALDQLPTDQASADQIQVGDVLQITIFEIGVSLFGTNNAASSALAVTGEAQGPPVANAQNMPPIEVPPDGQIDLPYIGRVTAAGLSPGELEAEIEADLRGKSQSPQAVVTFRQDEGNTVYLMGDLHSPGRKPLAYTREHLLDMIAIAGGATNNVQDSWVRVTRGGRSLEEPLGLIRSGAPDDIELRSHDRIEVIYRPRSFTAFGASGRVSEVMFQSPRVSLAEALARIGGPLDQTADPSGIFIFRAGQKTDEVPVIYKLDMRDPRSYFVAQQFEMRDKDLIYVANAESNAWLKFLTLVNIIVNPVITAKQVAQ